MGYLVLIYLVQVVACEWTYGIKYFTKIIPLSVVNTPRFIRNVNFVFDTKQIHLS